MSAPLPRHRVRHPRSEEAAAEPAATGALYDVAPGFDPEAGEFPALTDNSRTYAMSNLVGTLFQLQQRLLEPRQEVPIPWLQRVTVDAPLMRPRFKSRIEEMLTKLRQFIVEVTSMPRDVTQVNLTYMQGSAWEALSWLCNSPEEGSQTSFGDAAFTTLIDLMGFLIPPYVPEGAAFPQPRRGGTEPLDLDTSSFAMAHWGTWFGRLHTLASQLLELLEDIQRTRRAGVESIVTGGRFSLDDRAVSLGEGEGGMLGRLASENGMELMQRFQAQRTQAMWYEMRDQAYMNGLPGEPEYTTFENVGGGDCFYAALAMGIGMDGMLPSTELGGYSYAWFHDFIRNRAADMLLGPAQPEDRTYINAAYRRMWQAREDLLVGGQLDRFAEQRESWMYRPRADFPQTYEWRWGRVRLSEGPEKGETKRNFYARVASGGDTQAEPSQQPESRTAYNARVQRAFEAFVQYSRTSLYSGGGTPYWAQTHDVRAAAYAMQRRIHVYEIVNKVPGTDSQILRFKHYESYGNPCHRPVCIAWTVGNYDSVTQSSRRGYRIGAAPEDRFSNMHYAVILSKFGGHPTVGPELTDRNVLTQPYAPPRPSTGPAAPPPASAPSPAPPPAAAQGKRKSSLSASDDTARQLAEYRAAMAARQHGAGDNSGDAPMPDAPPAAAPPPAAPQPPAPPAAVPDMSNWSRLEQAQFLAALRERRRAEAAKRRADRGLSGA